MCPLFFFGALVYFSSFSIIIVLVTILLLLFSASFEKIHKKIIKNPSVGISFMHQCFFAFLSFLLLAFFGSLCPYEGEFKSLTLDHRDFMFCLYNLKVKFRLLKVDVG